MAVQTATGWDNAGALADLSVQPRVYLPEPGRRRRAGDGLTYIDGALVQRMTYGYLTKANYTTTLTEMGVASAESAKMTVRTLGRDGTEANWNAIITRPPAPELFQKVLGIEFEVLLVEAL